MAEWLSGETKWTLAEAEHKMTEARYLDLHPEAVPQPIKKRPKQRRQDRIIANLL